MFYEKKQMSNITCQGPFKRDDLTKKGTPARCKAEFSDLEDSVKNTPSKMDSVVTFPDVASGVCCKCTPGSDQRTTKR
jgi:hypothetical protein